MQQVADDANANVADVAHVTDRMEVSDGVGTYNCLSSCTVNPN